MYQKFFLFRIGRLSFINWFIKTHHTSLVNLLTTYKQVNRIFNIKVEPEVTQTLNIKNSRRSLLRERRIMFKLYVTAG